MKYALYFVLFIAVLLGASLYWLCKPRKGKHDYIKTVPMLLPGEEDSIDYTEIVVRKGDDT